MLVTGYIYITSVTYDRTIIDAYLSTIFIEQVTNQIKNVK